MREPASTTKIIDFCLALSGFGLAGGSVYLFFRMALLGAPTPVINGDHYLSIYAKPKTSVIAARRARQTQSVDFSPVGSLAGNLAYRASPAALTDFELIEATADTATIQSSHGRIQRVWPGATLAGGGRVLSIRRQDSQWTVLTTRGAIGKY